jgi:hypothetical protein
VPAVDGVVFADQRSSVVDIIQVIGRVLRPAPGKTVGTIVLPVEVADDADVDTELSLSPFGPVWTVLRALRAHDQRFDAEVAALHRHQIVGGGGERRLRRLVLDLPAGLPLPEVQLRLVREVGSVWDRNHALLERWARRHDGAILPRAVRVDHAGRTVNLGEWAEQQRVARRRGVLDRRRAGRLEQIPGWAWDQTHARWQATLGILHGYAAEHGTVAEPPAGRSRFAGMKDAERPRRDLGVWMATQRQAHRLGTLPTRTPPRSRRYPGGGGTPGSRRSTWTWSRRCGCSWSSRSTPTCPRTTSRTG